MVSLAGGDDDSHDDGLSGQFSLSKRVPCRVPFAEGVARAVSLEGEEAAGSGGAMRHGVPCLV